MAPATRRRTAAALMLAFIPLGLAWALIWPDNPDDTPAAFASAAAHDNAWKLAATLFVLSFAVVVPGLASMLGRVTERGRTLVTIGALLGAVGFVANTIAGTFSAYMALLAVQPDRAAMEHVWDGLDTIPLTVAISILIVLGHLGLILLAFGLRRARLAGWWLPVAMIVGMLGEAAIGPANHWAEVGTVAVVGAAMVGFARALVREAAPVPVDVAQPVPAAV
jgi:hypothetical protein